MIMETDKESHGGDIESLRRSKPGWLSRVFHIEPGVLLACDAVFDEGEWKRGETFRFLYRSKRGKFFLLEDLHRWSILEPDPAHAIYADLPVKVVEEETAFAPVTIEPYAHGREEEDDERPHLVVRNDKWEFSIWLELDELPAGWYAVGYKGTKWECLEYINQHCVFGAPNPHLLKDPDAGAGDLA